MAETTIYECPECQDRKMLDWSGEKNTNPTMWCSCEGFNVMEVVNGE